MCVTCTTLCYTWKSENNLRKLVLSNHVGYRSEIQVPDLVESALSELLDWPSSLVFKNPPSKSNVFLRWLNAFIGFHSGFSYYIFAILLFQHNEIATTKPLRIANVFILCVHTFVCVCRGQRTPSALTLSPLFACYMEFQRSSHLCLPSLPRELGSHILMLRNGLFCAARGSESGSSHLPNNHFYPQAIIISYYFLILLKWNNFHKVSFIKNYFIWLTLNEYTNFYLQLRSNACSSQLEFLGYLICILLKQHQVRTIYIYLLHVSNGPTRNLLMEPQIDKLRAGCGGACL